MKKMLIVILAALLLFTLSVPALVEESEKVIRVGGNATVSLAADTATVQIGVETRNESVKEAQRENANLMGAVLEAIKEVGIEEKDIVTSQFNVFSNYEYEPSVLGQETRKQYYQVQNTVSVTVHDLSMIGSVLDAAMDAGANTTYGISFSSTQANEAYQKALTRAVEDAMQKAQVLAKAAGVELGDLLNINATQNTAAFSRETYGMTNFYAYEAKSADMGTSISTGDVNVSAEVTLEYSFR
jgi:uncharacterized protein YggE